MGGSFRPISANGYDTHIVRTRFAQESDSILADMADFAVQEFKELCHVLSSISNLNTVTDCHLLAEKSEDTDNQHDNASNESSNKSDQIGKVESEPHVDDEDPGAAEQRELEVTEFLVQKFKGMWDLLPDFNTDVLTEEDEDTCFHVNSEFPVVVFDDETKEWIKMTPSLNWTEKDCHVLSKST